MCICMKSHIILCLIIIRLYEGFVFNCLSIGLCLVLKDRGCVELFFSLNGQDRAI